jgi:hypothetical protein
MLERLVRIIGGLALIAVGVGLAWWQGPLLVRDFRIGSDTVPAAQATLVKGQCKSRVFVVHFCDLQIDHPREGATHRTELNYIFLDFSFGDYTVSLLSPKDDSSTVTTDIGQGMLWNRALSLGGIVVLCLAFGVVLPFTKGSQQAQSASA